MKKTIKKGFTLVELLVVIAIIAILSAVSVIGYLSFTEKANKSVDEQMCTQYNIIIQAENVTNPELKIKDVINAIELQGLRSDQLLTKSRAYEFAFDREGQKLLLISTEDSTIQFPKNYEPKGAVWTVLREDLVFPANINHAEMLYSFSTKKQFTFKESAPAVSLMAATKEVVIEMNDCTLSLTDDKSLDNVTELKVTRGRVITNTKALSDKVKPATELGAKVEDIKNINKAETGNNLGLIFGVEDVKPAYNESNPLSIISCTVSTDKPALDNLCTNDANNNVVVDGKYFTAPDTPLIVKVAENQDIGITFHYSPSINLNVSGSKINTALTSGKTVTFKNCDFENVAITINNRNNGKLVFENCNFLNVMNWTLQIGAETNMFSFEVKGCSFINCGGGINATLPFNANSSEEVSYISNNTFDLIDNDFLAERNDAIDKTITALNALKVEIEKEDLYKKVNEKNNAIQLNDSEAGYVGEESTVFTKVEISNNEMKTGNAFLILHASLVGTDGLKVNTVFSDKKFELTKTVFATNITFANNNVHSNVKHKIFVDPDAKDNGDDYVTKLNELKDILDPLFK